MFDIALMEKISFFGREQHCLSYDGTTASDKRHMWHAVGWNHTLHRYNCNKGCTHRTCSIQGSHPESSSTDEWHNTSQSLLRNHCTWSAENAKQGNHYAGWTVPMQTRMDCFHTILCASSKPHSDNQLPHTRHYCSSGTSSNQLITLTFADDTAVF